MTQNLDFKLKCIVLGEEGVGKTSILRRVTSETIAQSSELIIGVEFFTKMMQVKNLSIKLLIWDMKSDPAFQRFRSTNYKGAAGCIIVSDLTSVRSFEHSNEWVNEVRQYQGNIPCLAVGNKKDLVDSRQISYDEAKKLAHTFNIEYLECSAKTGEGVEEIFIMLTSLMMKEIK